MKKKTKYSLTSKILVYPGMSGWRFLIIPTNDAQEIKANFGNRAKGWGSLPVTVTLNSSVWKTSIFPDKKSGTYFLPLKAKIRKAEEIFDEDVLRFSIKIDI
jgi:hypothetical protein